MIRLADDRAKVCDYELLYKSKIKLITIHHTQCSNSLIVYTICVHCNAARPRAHVSQFMKNACGSKIDESKRRKLYVMRHYDGIRKRNHSSITYNATHEAIAIGFGYATATRFNCLRSSHQDPFISSSCRGSQIICCFSLNVQIFIENFNNLEAKNISFSVINQVLEITMRSIARIIIMAQQVAIISVA